MSQPHGLGKGLASLIPQKGGVSLSDSPGSSSVRLGFEPIGTSNAPTPSASSQQSNRASSPPFSAGTHPLRALPASNEDSKSPVIRNESVRAPLAHTQQPVHVPKGSTDAKQEKIEGALHVPINDVIPNPHQPRTQFSEDKLLELSQSIREHGVLQPLIVTRNGDKYELIAGERRLQASKMAGLSEVPVVVREAGDQQKFEYAIIENIQRHDLNPIEEARAYERLSKEFSLSQEDIAKKMGRSRSSIANTVRLLQLPVDMQRAVSMGKVSEGHAKALLSIENSEKQRALFDLIVRGDLTVREAEAKSREISSKPPRKMISRDPNVEARERTLSEIFGTKVRIAKAGRGGSIRIDYFSDEEFGAIFSRLAGENESEMHDSNVPKVGL